MCFESRILWSFVNLGLEVRLGEVVRTEQAAPRPKRGRRLRIRDVGNETWR